jgi:DNA repair protein RadD
VITLRPYQEECIERIRAAFRAVRRRVLFLLPTGGGKTIIFAFIVLAAAERSRHVCILVHRQEILDQVDDALDAMGIDHGIISAGYPERAAPVQVASVMSLARRLDRYAGAFELLVIDEAHHAVAGTWHKVIGAFPQAFVLGVTATPERLDGRGLGDVFDEMVVGPSVAELTDLGFLSPAAVYAPGTSVNLSSVRIRAGDYDAGELARVMSDGGLVGDAVEHYQRLADGAPAVAFCCSIEHSQTVAARFADAGWRAAHVDGNTDRRERRRLIAALGRGMLDVLTNCGLISEGVDVPVLGAAILLRPTRSLALHLQMIGRALRPYPGKERTVILDHAGNTLQHGLPTDERDWSLASKRRSSRMQPAVVTIRHCPACNALVPANSPDCPHCDAVLIHRRNQTSEMAGDLVDAREMMSLRERLVAMSYRDVLTWADTEEKLHFVARARGYKQGWVWHEIRERREREAAVEDAQA